MYKSFYVKDFDKVKIENNDSSKLDDYWFLSKKTNNDALKEVVKSITNDEQGINQQGIYEQGIKVKEISDNFFKKIECNIFLSHSHEDINKVIKLAIFLEKEYRCKVFIDSIFWENIYDLLKEFDNIYCKDDGNFDYQKRNCMTSNFFIILNTALHKMIEISDYFFFLETKQSTTKNRYLTSPWIFSELSFATQVSRRKPENKLFENYIRNQEKISLEAQKKIEKIIKFFYQIPDLDYTLSSDQFSYYILGGKSHTPS